MTYKVTAKLFFDNGQVKKVDWLERGLVKKVSVAGKDTEVPLDLEEAQMELRKLFLKYGKSGDVLTVPNIQGEVSMIPFSKLYYATVAVATYSGDGDAADTTN